MSTPITELLHDLKQGRPEATDLLVRAVHGKLQAIAQREISDRYGGNHGLTLEPGILATDALMKILDQETVLENRRHFFAYATRIMVRALIDHQRQRWALKRGRSWLRVTLSGVVGGAKEVDVEDLQEALKELERLDQRKAMIVQLRVFWGMTVPETAEVLEVSPSTVDREWRFSLRWLSTRLRPDSADP